MTRLLIPALTEEGLLYLKWSDFDWDRNRFSVIVRKKEHIDGHETRVVPIFPDLMPHLERARVEAEADPVYVVPDIRSGEKNLRTGLLRVLKKADIPVWPKLFQNLRASRETELMRQEPAHLVHAWVGNSEGVAEDHYLMATDEDFERAAGKPTLIPTLSALIAAAQALSPETRKAVSPAFAKDTAVQIPPRGKELPQVFPKKTASDSRGDVRSDVSAREDSGSPSPAAPDALADLVARLSALPPETLAALRTLFGGEPPPA